MWYMDEGVSESSHYDVGSAISPIYLEHYNLSKNHDFTYYYQYTKMSRLKTKISIA